MENINLKRKKGELLNRQQASKENLIELELFELENNGLQGD